MNFIESAEHIADIELTQLRVYPLDLNHSDPHGMNTKVVAAPGLFFPVFRSGFTRWWMISGSIQIDRLGDGMFILPEDDTPDGPNVTIPSKFYGPDEWVHDLVNYGMFTEGSQFQRYRWHAVTEGYDAP